MPTVPKPLPILIPYCTCTCAEVHICCPRVLPGIPPHPLYSHSALPACQLDPVPCRTTKAAFALREAQMTDIQKQIREDVTRFR